MWITPGAAPLRWMGPNRNLHWSTSGLRVTLLYLCVKKSGLTPDINSTESKCTETILCHNHKPVLSSFMTCHRVLSKSSTTVQYVEQELLALPEHLSSPRFFWGSCYSIFSFLCNVLSIFVCPFSFWPLYCTSFFDLRLLITLLVS